MTNPAPTSADVRRWLGWLALVIAFSIACAFLSHWQFGRRGEALTAMTRLDSNYAATPVPLESLEKPWGYHSANEWRQVILTGHYLPANAMLIRNRPLDGNPGFLEVVPFQLTDGTLMLIERGWLATTSDYAAPSVFALPSSGDQTVIGHLRAAEPDQGSGLPKGQLASINVSQFAKAQGLKDRVFEFSYVRMATESVAASASLQILSKPTLDEGNHLSYALQWILFALMASAALIWAIRKENQARAGIKRVARKDSDSAYEDSELDA